MGKLSRSSRISSRKSKDEVDKKQTKISSYFQVSPKKPEELFPSKASQNLLVPNLMHFSSNSKTTQSNISKNGISSKLNVNHLPTASKNILPKTPDRFSKTSKDDDSDIEIIECTPESKTHSIFEKLTSIESPEIIPPTPNIQQKTINVSANLSTLGNSSKLKSVLEPSFRNLSKSKTSKSNATKLLSSKLLSWDVQRQNIKNVKPDTSSSLKRGPESGVGISPNSKKCNEQQKDYSLSKTCKVNILEKLKSPVLFDNSNSESDSSFSLLQPSALGLNEISLQNPHKKDILCSPRKESISGKQNEPFIVLNTGTECLAHDNSNQKCITASQGFDVIMSSIDPALPEKSICEQISPSKCFDEGSKTPASSLIGVTKLRIEEGDENPESLQNGDCDEGVKQPGLESVSSPSKIITSTSNFKNEDSLDELLQIDFDKFSPFKDIQHQPKEEKSKKKIDRILAQGLGELSFAVKGNFGRFVVTSIRRDIYQRELLLDLKSPQNGASWSCSLTGFWYESVIKEGDIVHILFAEEEGNKFRISNEKGIIVVNPDFLVSGTSVVSGVYCRRKAVLNERFKGYDSGNKIMIIGSVVHLLFQEVVKRKSVTLKEIDALIHNLVTQPKILRDLYGMQLKEDDIILEMKKFTPLIQTWSKTYLGTDKTLSSIPAKRWKGRITAIKDIEENIWSPRFGLKGKIDLTVEAYDGLSTKIVPLELKTGKSSFSAEHKGQVTLYSMMMSDRRPDPLSGLLLYLRDGAMAEVPAGEKEKKALIQLRNDLVHYLANPISGEEKELPVLPPFPEPLNSERSCARCPHLLTCTALQKVQEESYPPPHAMSTLVPMATGHLSNSHLEYFRKWCLMLNLEIGATANESSIRSLWCLDATQRESSGSCLVNMVIDSDVVDMANGYFRHCMKRDPHSTHPVALPHNFQYGDSIVVSTGKEIALSQGVVYAVGVDSIVLVLDRNLVLQKGQGELFLVDRCEYQNTMSIFFTNLAQLLTPSDRCHRLRELIIDQDTPKFTVGVDRNAVALIRDILILLNQEQQRAVLRSLLAKDYSILKGFPGTGKTSTIVGLVRVLSAMGHSILLTSYTHSAVDNILLKLKEFEDVKFLRLGKTSRIHKDLLDFSDGVLTQGMTSLKQMEEFYSEVSIVGTTCLGMGHSIFRRKTFDFCIIDEASQVLEAAALGPLFFSSRFVLVGDSLQLPPVIKSQTAKSIGMMESLFERLDNEAATVCLTLQYRMNEPIMALANRLIYEGKLKCGTEELKTATLCVSEEKFQTLPPWLQKIVSPKIEDSALFINTMKDAPEGKNCGGQPVNHREALLIHLILKTFCQLGVPPEEIGVITPYRAQVKLLKETIMTEEEELGTQIEVNTVDQYQGRDKSVIIYSCVRAGLRLEDVRKGEILNDIRRLNVAVTRAKRKLIIVGDLETLNYFDPFKKLLSDLPKNSIYELSQDADEFSWEVSL